jgi:hypothetical protein
MEGLAAIWNNQLTDSDKFVIHLESLNKPPGHYPQSRKLPLPMKASSCIASKHTSNAIALFGAATAASLIVASPAFAQTDNFDSGTDAAWTHYAPGALGQTFSFPTNPISAGNLGYKITSNVGTSVNPGRVGSFLMGGPVVSDFSVTTDLINWNNTQSQFMGVMARVQSPIPASSFPLGYALVYTDRFSAGAGGTDQLRLYKVVAGGLGFMNTTTGGGQTNGDLGNFGQVVGGDAPPNPSKDYQLVFTGIGNLFSGQIIDKSTGLALTFNDGFGGLTNTIWAADPGFAGFGSAGATLYNSGNAGLFAFVGSGTPPGNIDPTFDNFGVLIVPEPSVTALASVGSAALVWVARRRSLRNKQVSSSPLRTS